MEPVYVYNNSGIAAAADRLYQSDEVKNVIYQKTSVESHYPVILVAGNFSSGKTALIQAFCPDAESLSPANLIEYKTCSAAEINSDANCIWYCIDGSSAQIRENDLKRLKKLSGKLLLVITKFDLMNNEERITLMDTLLKYLDSEEIVFVSAENETGLKRLAALTQQICTATMNLNPKDLCRFNTKWEKYFRNKLDMWQSYEDDDSACCIRQLSGNMELSPALLCKLSGIRGVPIDSGMAQILREHIQKNRG